MRCRTYGKALGAACAGLKISRASGPGFYAIAGRKCADALRLRYRGKRLVAAAEARPKFDQCDGDAEAQAGARAWIWPQRSGRCLLSSASLSAFISEKTWTSLISHASPAFRLEP